MDKPILKLAGLLLVSWCVMTFTHELGHLLVGWAGGGHLQEAELRPWHLPHSRFAPDPHPLATLWGGPLLGVLLPVVMATIIRTDWASFVASFSVMANGAYLALAWLSGDRWLDTPRLLAEGAWPITIGLYCLLTIGFGYWQFRKSVLKALRTQPRPANPVKTTGKEN